MDILSFILGLLPAIIAGAIGFYIQRKQKMRDAAVDKRAEARKCESLLLLDLQMATAKLSYACAMALKRGSTNGEVEEGVAAYEEAKDRYTKFLNQQAVEHLREE